MSTTQPTAHTLTHGAKAAADFLFGGSIDLARAHLPENRETLAREIDRVSGHASLVAINAELVATLNKIEARLNNLPDETLTEAEGLTLSEARAVLARVEAMKKEGEL